MPTAKVVEIPVNYWQTICCMAKFIKWNIIILHALIALLKYYKLHYFVLIALLEYIIGYKSVCLFSAGASQYNIQEVKGIHTWD